MLPPASDGHEAPSLRPTDDDPERPTARGEPDVLSGLVRMVTERASRVGGAPSGEPNGMDTLREAVDALGHYLDALELLRSAGIEVGEPGAADVLPDPVPTPEAHPEPRARPLPAGPRLASEPPADLGAPGEPSSGDGSRDSGPEPAPGRDSDTGPDPAVERTAGAPAVDDPPPRPAAGRAGDDGDRRYPAFRDRSTGLLSREGFEWIASGELKRCARHGRVFTILLLRLGPMRDDTLRRTAEVVTRGLRGSDVAGREGEGAVVVALPETAQREARAVGQRLIAELGAADVWSHDGRIGMAAYPTHGETVWSLLETARGTLSPRAGNVLQGGGDGGYRSG